MAKKNDIDNLPVRHVRSPEQLAELCDSLRQLRRFGFDTEFIAERSYRPRVCLLQVSTPDEAILVDPLPNLDLTPFWELVLDPDIEAVTHAGQADYLLCYHTTGQLPHGGFDTQLAAGFLGYGYPCGYGTLVHAVLGVKLDKHETLTDWSVRPLRPEQLTYAVDDVRYLLPLYGHLTQKLEQRGRRDWVDEEDTRQKKNVFRRLTNGQAFRDVGGSGGLGSESLAVLRALHAWREDTAQARDRPARRVMQDHLLVELAKRRPRGEEQIRQIRGIQGSLPRGTAKELLDAVAEGLNIPAAERPKPAERNPFPPELRPVVDIVRAALRQLAVNLDIDPGLLGTRDDLERYIARFYRRPDELSADTLSTGWRGECVGPLLERLLSGDVSLRLRRTNGGPRVEIDGM